jgi:hypothetical protein
VLSIGDASPAASLVPDTRPLPTSALASDGSTLVMVGTLGARVESFHRGKDEKR